MDLFSKIIAGEIPSFKIRENDLFYAFLDINPTAPGHTLVVPKTEVDRLFDLEDIYLKDILTFAKPIANAIRKAFNYDRVNIVTIGFEIAHAHIHLVPMNSMQDADAINKTKLKPSQEELKNIQEKILKALEN